MTDASAVGESLANVEQFRLDHEREQAQRLQQLTVCLEATEHQRDRIVTECQRQAQEIARLKDYVQHTPDCLIDAWMHYGVMRTPEPDCTCGLQQILDQRDGQ